MSKSIVISAPSGAGKTSIVNYLINEMTSLEFSISACNRKKRKDEIDGKHYHFLSDEEFQARIDENDFLEWEEFYGGKRYGTLQSEVDKSLKLGYFVLLDIEVKGAVNINKIYGDECLSIFVQPPSLEVLKQR